MTDDEARDLSQKILRAASLTLVLDRIETQQHVEAVRRVVGELLKVRKPEAG